MIVSVRDRLRRIAHFENLFEVDPTRDRGSIAVAEPQFCIHDVSQEEEGWRKGDEEGREEVVNFPGGGGRSRKERWNHWNGGGRI